MAGARGACRLLVALAGWALHGACPAGMPGAATHRPTPQSADVARLAGWVRATGDSQGRAFIIVDKRAAQLHVFDAAGARLAASAVLLGLARADQVVPGSADRELALVRPSERITPAGRFVSEPGRNLNGERIVWVDYDNAISIHRVRATNASEKRLQRLASATAADNRITYGCINVPAPFYDANVAPLFGQTPGVVYVLPETRPVARFFGAAGRTGDAVVTRRECGVAAGRRVCRTIRA